MLHLAINRILGWQNKDHVKATWNFSTCLLRIYWTDRNTIKTTTAQRTLKIVMSNAERFRKKERLSGLEIRRLSIILLHPNYRQFDGDCWHYFLPFKYSDIKRPLFGYYVLYFWSTDREGQLMSWSPSYATLLFY